MLVLVLDDGDGGEACDCEWPKYTHGTKDKPEKKEKGQ